MKYKQSIDDCDQHSNVSNRIQWNPYIVSARIPPCRTLTLLTTIRIFYLPDSCASNALHVLHMVFGVSRPAKVSLYLLKNRPCQRLGHVVLQQVDTLRSPRYDTMYISERFGRNFRENTVFHIVSVGFIHAGWPHQRRRYIERWQRLGSKG